MNTLYFGVSIEETRQSEAAPKKARQPYEILNNKEARRCIN
ncbi:MULTISPECIES: hypothetical protein [Staphylococcus]|nr:MULTISPECIES: hypothetical protein [Staphylococcus]MDU9371100.1 hypothetical protein [Staphylococcus ureilyticus]